MPETQFNSSVSTLQFYVSLGDTFGVPGCSDKVIVTFDGRNNLHMKSDKAQCVVPISRARSPSDNGERESDFKSTYSKRERVKCDVQSLNKVQKRLLAIDAQLEMMGLRNLLREAVLRNVREEASTDGQLLQRISMQSFTFSNRIEEKMQSWRRIFAYNDYSWDKMNRNFNSLADSAMLPLIQRVSMHCCSATSGNTIEYGTVAKRLLEGVQWRLDQRSSVTNLINRLEVLAESNKANGRMRISLKHPIMERSASVVVNILSVSSSPALTSTASVQHVSYEIIIDVQTVFHDDGIGHQCISMSITKSNVSRMTNCKNEKVSCNLIENIGMDAAIDFCKALIDVE